MIRGGPAREKTDGDEADQSSPHRCFGSFHVVVVVASLVVQNNNVCFVLFHGNKKRVLRMSFVIGERFVYFVWVRAVLQAGGRGGLRSVRAVLVLIMNRSEARSGARSWSKRAQAHARELQGEGRKDSWNFK